MKDSVLQLLSLSIIYKKKEKMEKKFKSFASVALFSVCVIVFNACSNEDDVSEIVDLRIEAQISAVNLTTVCDGGFGPKIPRKQDECVLYAFTYLRMKKPNNYNADPNDLYEEMSRYAYSKGYEGGSMSDSIMMLVGEKFKIVNEQVKFGNGENELSVADFFHASSLPNIKMVIVSGSPNAHTGVFIRYNRKEDTVDFEDADGIQTVPISSIISVVY